MSASMTPVLSSSTQSSPAHASAAAARQRYRLESAPAINVVVRPKILHSFLCPVITSTGSPLANAFNQTKDRGARTVARGCHFIDDDGGMAGGDGQEEAAQGGPHRSTLQVRLSGMDGIMWSAFLRE